MNCYIITYDIPSSLWNTDLYYDRLYNYFKTFKFRAWINRSTWAVKGYTNAIAIRNTMKQLLPPWSSIFVIKSWREAARENTKCDWLRLSQNL